MVRAAQFDGEQLPAHWVLCDEKNKKKITRSDLPNSDHIVFLFMGPPIPSDLHVFCFKNTRNQLLLIKMLETINEDCSLKSLWTAGLIMLCVHLSNFSFLLCKRKPNLRRMQEAYNSTVTTTTDEQTSDSAGSSSEDFGDAFGSNLWKVAVIFLGLILFVLAVEFVLECITKVSRKKKKKKKKMKPPLN